MREVRVRVRVKVRVKVKVRVRVRGYLKFGLSSSFPMFLKADIAAGGIDEFVVIRTVVRGDVSCNLMVDMRGG